MIQKKMCILGAFAVGKTSLVRRFVSTIFDEKYLTTVGVKIDKKTISVDGQELMLLLWDIEGQDVYHTVQTSYLRGASGYFLVADGTRGDTIAAAIDLKNRMEEQAGRIPHLLLINKSDLKESWEVEQEDLNVLSESGMEIRITSAKTGEEVEEAFFTLAGKMLR